MGYCRLRLTVKILVILRLTVIFFLLRLTDLLKIHCHCLRKLKINDRILETFCGRKRFSY